MKNLNIKAINTGDGDLQSRVKVDESVVADYAQVLKEGGELPPVVVFFDGADNWLADGFHRLHAYNTDKRASIPADVRAGTRRDAMLYSFGANGAHGLRRTNDDKRKAVSAMLADAIWCKWSDRDIAKACGVGVPFVGAMRRPEVAQKQQQNRETSAQNKVQSDYAYPQAASDHAREVPKKEAPPKPDDFGPDAEELAMQEAAEEADAETIAFILASDDKLNDCYGEIKRLKAVVVGLEQRIAGFQNANNEHIRTIKSLRAKLAKVEQAA